MPEGTRVHRCVDKKRAGGMPISSAIRICQASTGQSFKTGRAIKKRQMPRKGKS